MWVIVERIALAMLVLVSITEFFYPLLTGKPLFGSFRKKRVETRRGVADDSLKEKVSQAKEKVEEVKKVQEEVNDNFRSAEQLKEESDDLMK